MLLRSRQRDGCPCFGDYDGCESDTVFTGAPTQVDSLPVCENDREPTLKKLDGLSISKEGSSKILELLQKDAMVKSARRA